MNEVSSGVGTPKNRPLSQRKPQNVQYSGAAAGSGG